MKGRTVRAQNVEKRKGDQGHEERSMQTDRSFEGSATTSTAEAASESLERFSQLLIKWGKRHVSSSHSD